MPTITIHSRRIIYIIVGLAVGVSFLSILVKNVEASTNLYLRVLNTNSVYALQVGICELAPSNEGYPTIALVGVVHIGSEEYYDRLQQILECYEVVLYEGIGDVSKRENETFSLQRELAKALGLEYQLDKIDYQRSNFRNADLTIEEILAAFRHIESPHHILPQSLGRERFNWIVDFMNGTGLHGKVAKLLLSIISNNPQLQAITRLVFIEVLGNLPEDLTLIREIDPGLGEAMNVIINYRNEYVIKQIQRFINSKQKRINQIAVFYGAGHMPLLERRICEELGYKPISRRYLTAFEVDLSQERINPLIESYVRKIISSELKAMRPASTLQMNSIH